MRKSFLLVLALLSANAFAADYVQGPRSSLAFAGSLWFYALRFAPFNPGRSLLPCIVGHLTKNLGVFALKGAAGFVSGWY